MALISELETKMTVNNTQFLRGIEQSSASVAGFVDGIKHIAEVLVVFELFKTGMEKVIDIVTEGTKEIADLEETSKRLAVGVGPLQELQYAAKQSGVSVESLTKSIGFMEANLGKGSSTTIAALKNIGLTLDELKGLSGTEQYEKIGTAIGKLTDQTVKATTAKAIFGRAGIQNLSLFNRDINALTSEFKTFGGELTGKQTAAVKEYAESVNKLNAIWEAFKLQLTSAVAGPFKQVLDWITETIVKMGGVGEVAKLFAKEVIAGTQVTIKAFAAILSVTDAVILNIERLIKLMLQVGEVSTLGLSKVFSDSDKWIGNLESDIAKKQVQSSTPSTATQLSNGLNSLNNQIGRTQQDNNTQKVEVTVNAEEGLSAKVAQSYAVKARINQMMDIAFSSAASSVGK